MPYATLDIQKRTEQDHIIIIKFRNKRKVSKILMTGLFLLNGGIIAHGYVLEFAFG